MKCIRLKGGTQVFRIRNELAHQMVTVRKEAEYVSKKEWKDGGRQYATPKS